MSAPALRASVCMAVYNGAPFLVPQLESIFAQLGADDELIVVDDASEDDSAAILSSVREARLRLYRNDRNLGVLASFERALGLASGQIIFLSDQDDIWLPGRLQRSAEVFSSHPTVTMVATDANLIDDHGRILAPSFFAQRGRFAAGAVHNFVKNKYLGCTLSFRREMLGVFLPIPRDVPMHDIWFGILNAIYGRTYFIDEPLVAYRRHARNASPARSAGLKTMGLWRYRLAKNLAVRVMRHALQAKARPPVQ